MTLTELKYIVAVARDRHFGKAAEACHVSQPTLSVAIKKLEDELEVKLFERSATEVTVRRVHWQTTYARVSTVGRTGDRALRSGGCRRSPGRGPGCRRPHRSSWCCGGCGRR